MSDVVIPEYRDEVAETIAAYVVNVSGTLSEKTQTAAKRALQDSVAVALGAFGHPATQLGRRFAELMSSASGPCVIWGTSIRTTPDVAALINGSLMRGYDYNDFFVGRRNSGHPSDITTGVIAAAEWKGVSGAKLLEALAVGYEVVAAMFDCFTTAPGGWDYTNLTGIGACAAIARVIGLDYDQTREALGIAVVPHMATDEVESCELNKRGDLTMWKRFNGSDAVRNALQACLLASVGIEGAIRPFVGNNGFLQKMKNDESTLPLLKELLDPAKPLSRVADTYMKLYPVGSVGQSAIRAALEAREQVSDLSAIKEVRVFSEEGAYDHLVAIRQDAYNPISRETADHSMPYIVGAAVLDGFIRVESFDLDRVLEPARRAFVRDQVKVVIDLSLGAMKDGKLKRASDGYLSRVEIELNDGTVVHGAAQPFPGHPKAPFTDAEIEEKLRYNAEQFAGKGETDAIIALLSKAETMANVRDLTALLTFDCAANISLAA
ncbi:MmgE/PrpD family protein [Flavisphingomonas formosensis]|uniref:MmgE/PrpD family protein n=1 Tax=Flavisphingomonas formosensis TaxID=861534 RepID=UPI0012F8B2E4|nr:MmgE/PrpD family protein [Sphingomonas formosensis]